MIGKTLLVALVALIACAGAVSAESTVHTVITTECGEYFSWQSMGKAVCCRNSVDQSAQPLQQGERFILDPFYGADPMKTPQLP